MQSVFKKEIINLLLYSPDEALHISIRISLNDREYIIDSMTFLSKGKNTPFNGWKVKGLVKATICDGKVVYQSE